LEYSTPNLDQFQTNWALNECKAIDCSHKHTVSVQKERVVETGSSIVWFPKEGHLDKSTTQKLSNIVKITRNFTVLCYFFS
jgi:hypothetical protein